MNGVAQVWHVAKKDAREHRRALVIYAGIVAVATAHAVGWFAPTGDVFDWMMPVVMFFGMLLAASLVQSDSPIRADAFWTTRPLSPSAVFGAKIAVAALALVGVGAIGELAGFIAHDISPARIPSLLLESVWTYARWLLMAMVVAAVTRDLRTFVVTAIVIPVAMLLIVSLLFVGSSSVDIAIGTRRVTWAMCALLGLVCAPVALMYLYRTRDERAKAWFAASTAVLGTVLSFAAPTPDTSVVEAPSSLPRATLTVDLPDSANVVYQAQLNLRLAATGAPPGQRLTLLRPVAAVALRDGRTLRLPISNPFIELGSTAPVLPPGTTWVGRDPSQSSSMTVGVSLTPDQRRALRGGVTRVTVEGTMLARVAHVGAILPLQRGVQSSHDGEQINVRDVTMGFGTVAVSIKTSTIPDAQTSGMSFSEPAFRFVLLNENLHQAAPIYQAGTTGRGGWLVLPGAGVEQSVGTLAAGSRRAGDSATLSDAWFRSARLGVLEWERLGAYPVQSAAAVVPP